MALINRSVFREALAALIDANDNFDLVFDYMPNITSDDNRWPIVFVTSGGTDQEMLSYQVNPSDFIVKVEIAVRENDSVLGGTWTETDAEGKIDELDQIIRQIIRDNVGAVSGASAMRIEGASTTGWRIIGGVSYRAEEYTVIGHNLES
jgi:hypothetical protein